VNIWTRKPKHHTVHQTFDTATLKQVVASSPTSSVQKSNGFLPRSPESRDTSFMSVTPSSPDDDVHNSQRTYAPRAIRKRMSLVVTSITVVQRGLRMIGGEAVRERERKCCDFAFGRHYCLVRTKHIIIIIIISFLGTVYIRNLDLMDVIQTSHRTYARTQCTYGNNNNNNNISACSGVWIGVHIIMCVCTHTFLYFSHRMFLSCFFFFFSTLSCNLLLRPNSIPMLYALFNNRIVIVLVCISTVRTITGHLLAAPYGRSTRGKKKNSIGHFVHVRDQ
jgi:hypothetical protein